MKMTTYAVVFFILQKGIIIIRTFHLYNYLKTCQRYFWEHGKRSIFSITLNKSIHKVLEFLFIGLIITLALHIFCSLDFKFFQFKMLFFIWDKIVSNLFSNFGICTCCLMIKYKCQFKSKMWWNYQYWEKVMYMK